MTAVVVVVLAVLAVNVLLVLALLIRYIRECRGEDDEQWPVLSAQRRESTEHLRF